MHINGRNYLESYKRLEALAHKQNDTPLDKDGRPDFPHDPDRVHLQGVTQEAEIRLDARFWFNQTASLAVTHRPFEKGPETRLSFSSELSMAGPTPYLQVTEDVLPEQSDSIQRTTFRLHRETGRVSRLESKTIESGYKHVPPAAYDANQPFQQISGELDRLRTGRE